MASRRLLATALVAVGVVVWLALRDPGSGGRSEAAAPVNAPAGVGTGSNHLAESELQPPTDEEARSSPASAPASDREEPPADGELWVRVVDAAGRPRGGVPVVLLVDAPDLPAPVGVGREVTSADSGLARLDASLRLEALPEGTHFLAGIDLPLEPRVQRSLGSWVPARRWTAEVVELVLPEGGDAWLGPLRVVVVDARGEPVIGARVELVGRPRLTPSDDNRLADATTRAPDGLAELSRERMGEARDHLALLQVAVDHEVRCRGPYLPVPSVPVPAQPTAEPLRIVLPPTASVVARVRRHDGTPVVQRANVVLEYRAPGQERRAGYVSAPVESGLARFDHVGLGLDLQLTASLEDASTSRGTARLAGPVAADELVEIELTLGPVLPRLVGRILDASGEPARDFLFFLSADLHDPPARHPAAGPRRVSASAQATDSEGRFALPWSGDATAAGRFLRIEARPHPKTGAPPGWVPRFAEAPFPTLSADGTLLDIGDVTLSDLPVVLAGRVIDAQGEPVNQAWLSIGYPQGEGRNERWYNLSVPGTSRLSTRPDGTFEARSLQRVRALRVSASRNDLGRSPAVEVPPGTLDVRLALAPGEDTARTRGRVQGRLLVDEDIPLLSIEVLLHGERGQSSNIPVAGMLLLEAVPPGTYRLAVRTADTEFLLDEVEDVVVAAGRTTRDARLQRVDLRGRLRLLRVRLATTEGDPIADASVRLGVGHEGGTLGTDDGGRLIAPVRTEDEVFELAVAGFAPVQVSWSPDEQSLILARQ